MTAMQRLCALALAVGMTSVALALADDSKPAKEPPDPPGTTVYMDQFRSLFANWDLNSDGFLDKDELAKAFRGPDAKAYDYKKSDSTASDKDSSKSTSTDSSSKDGSTSSKDGTSSKAAKPDYTMYPDYNFLIAVDQDGDGQVSRSEFLSWARDYSTTMKQQADQEAKVLALEAKLQSAKQGSKEFKKIEAELKGEQAAFNKMQSQVKAEVKAIQKAMQQQPKKK
jgi:Ca2+-binding EF-hand superfamily protein